MIENETLIHQNFDLLIEFINQGLQAPNLANQIPDGACVFHGTYQDKALTEINLNRATRVLLGMTLGYVQSAQVVMIFEYQPGQYKVLNLTTDSRQRQVRTLINTWQTQQQQEISAELTYPLAA